MGYVVQQEVEIGNGSARGWIDILAFHPVRRVLHVGEIKTELLDVGGVQRQLGWYARTALRAAAKLGWHPQSVIVGLYLLLTDANDEALRLNRHAMSQAFPVRARELHGRLAGANPVGSRQPWAVALVDPLSRRRDWIRPSRSDGRKSPAPYHSVRRLHDPVAVTRPATEPLIQPVVGYGVCERGPLWIRSSYARRSRSWVAMLTTNWIAVLSRTLRTMSDEKRAGPRPVMYRGEPLDAERGPGLGCFWFQVVVLAFLIVLTPLSVAWGWPSWLSALLLFAVIGLLLVAGQTIIFLLRLVAAERREGRRRPLASTSPTVGEIEDRGHDVESGADEAGETDTKGVRE